MQTTTRTRAVKSTLATENTAVHLALAILQAAGIASVEELAVATGDHDFAGVDSATLARFFDGKVPGVETANAYPDRVFVLDDGTVLIADLVEANAMSGGQYADEVMSAEPQTLTPQISDRERELMDAGWIEQQAK